ncbi:DJ-1/PfpI family protein, partial [Bacillus sp. D-CC]
MADLLFGTTKGSYTGAIERAGLFEVLSVTEANEEKPFTVYTVSQNGEMITARNGLKVKPDYSIEDLPPVDILLIPGGKGVRENEVKNDIIINWVRQQMKEVKLMTSVCTGALLLAKGLELLYQNYNLEHRSLGSHFYTYKIRKKAQTGLFNFTNQYHIPCFSP